MPNSHFFGMLVCGEYFCLELFCCNQLDLRQLAVANEGCFGGFNLGPLGWIEDTLVGWVSYMLLFFVSMKHAQRIHGNGIYTN